MSDSKFVTPDEQAYYSRLFRQPWLSDIVQVFQRGEEEFFDILQYLRSKPRAVSFSLSSGARLQFLSVEKKWTDGGLRLLFSNGTVGGFRPIGFPCARILDEEMGPWCRGISPEEEFLHWRYRERDRLYLPVEQRALPANEETKTALKHFGCGRPLATTTLEQLAQLNAPVPDENFATIVRQWQKTDKTSPKELLVLALEEAVHFALSVKLCGERLWQMLYDRTNPMDMTIKELLSGWDVSSYDGREPAYRPMEYHEVISRSIVNFASQLDDLVIMRLWDHPALNVTLKTAYERGFLKPRRVGNTLANNVATRLGFQVRANGWAKAKDRHELNITEDGDVYIDHAKVCMHPVENQSLPKGDVITSLLMTLGTDLRRRVLSGPDLEAVESLLPLDESIIALKGLTKQMKEK